VMKTVWTAPGNGATVAELQRWLDGERWVLIGADERAGRATDLAVTSPSKPTDEDEERVRVALHRVGVLMLPRQCGTK